MNKDEFLNKLLDTRIELVRQMPGIDDTGEGWEDAVLCLDHETDLYYVASTISSETMVFTANADGTIKSYMGVASYRSDDRGESKRGALNQLADYVRDRKFYDVVVRVYADEFPGKDNFAEVFRDYQTELELFAVQRSTGHGMPVVLDTVV